MTDVRSMTGFGRGVAEQGGTVATVDLRAVNHRYLDLKLRGSLAPALEEAISSKIRGALERGSIAIAVHVTGSPGSSRIDQEAAKRAHAHLAQLAQALGVAPPELGLVLAQPGVLVAADDRHDDPIVLRALDAALAQLDQMRHAEGAALAFELTSRFDELATLRARIAELSAGAPALAQKRLAERIARLGADVEPHRLAQEVAMFADRADVTEELVRLASHLDQARALVAAQGAVGRRLDFLVQEIGRELNTVGSKSALADITSAVVEAKATLEKLREQIQNVE
jgi:uncharacterized protein (TIGR00255 family)